MSSRGAAAGATADLAWDRRRPRPAATSRMPARDHRCRRAGTAPRVAGASAAKSHGNSRRCAIAARAGGLALRVLWTFTVNATAADTTRRTDRRLGPEVLIAVLAIALVLVV